MSNIDDELNFGTRRTLQQTDDGRIIAVQDSGGLSASFGGSVPVIEASALPDEDWQAIKDALPTHAIVLDNSTDGFTLRKRRITKGQGDK